MNHELRTMNRTCAAWLLIACAFFPAAAHAQIPPLVRYQGFLKDSQGVPLEGPYTLTFRLYPAATGGTPLWTEPQQSVPVTQGSFSVLLGSVTSLASTDWSSPLWLSIQVGTDPELAPRQQITSVPLAVRASVAESLSTPVTTSNITDDANRLVPSGAIVLWTGASCPTGYTRVTLMDNKFLVSGSAFNAAAGGSNTHAHGGVTQGHALTIAEMPSHGHDIDIYMGDGNDQVYSSGSYTNHYMKTGVDYAKLRGGGQNHTHPINSADSRPEFATVLLCQKN